MDFSIILKLAIIVLLTDFGSCDEYVGVLKGVILRINPKVRVFGLNYEIPPQDILWAGYCLASAYKFFPKEQFFSVWFFQEWEVRGGF